MATPVVMAVGGRSGWQGGAEGRQRESSSPSPPTPRPRILVVGVKGGEGLQGEAGRRGRQGDGWCLLTSPPPLHAWLQQAAPATQARGEEVEDDDNNADDAKSGFVDPRASLTGVLASSCPAHWPPHRLQVIGGVADR
uniref:Uncharacterized protein n=1 Tax=Oryza glumipatula TaxID=40148 RepID=A0A0E0BRF2_9ORYZ